MSFRKNDAMYLTRSGKYTAEHLIVPHLITRFEAQSSVGLPVLDRPKPRSAGAGSALYLAYSSSMMS